MAHDLRPEVIASPVGATALEGKEHPRHLSIQPNDIQDDSVEKLLQLFPDACITFLKAQFKEHHETHGSNVVGFLADKFLEKGYSRVEKVGQKRKRETKDENPIKPKYDDPERPPENWEYRELIRRILRDEFSLIPVAYIDKVAKHERFLLAAYLRLMNDEQQATVHPASAPYRTLGKPRKPCNNDSIKMGQCWTRIMDELEYSRREARTKRIKEQVDQDAQLAAQLNEEEHEETKMLWECQCCFSDVPFDSMTHCGEGLHFFCLDCARMNAENEIGNSRHKLMCMDGSGCRAEFTRSEIARFLDSKAIMALSKLQQEEALRVAAIDGLVQCPFCDYAEIYGPVEEDREFRCQNAGCEVISCRLCRKKTHIPLSCKEAAKDDIISVRHAVEEAMTQAMIRKCNKCKTPFIKDIGCNKMICTKPGCRSMQCYVCSKTVNGYDHFNDQARGGSKGNCPLFDNVEERHEEEIRLAAEEARKKLREEHPELQDEDLEIELSEAVKQHEETRRKQAQPAHMVYPPANVAPPPAPRPPPVPRQRAPRSRAGPALPPPPHIPLQIRGAANFVHVYPGLPAFHNGFQLFNHGFMQQHQLQQHQLQQHQLQQHPAGPLPAAPVAAEYFQLPARAVHHSAAASGQQRSPRPQN
ncbi:hypothetical protein FN846DRAFT_779179 [Sphaerosporella brunnea]|uniref:RING-type domain-containing protein n=1 Tax=Sphaerosporella brunnea TaxID=1250544 RepID=A0A5J5EV57_9PEZI|nr:hypothetical protein FN846DRAFT_779272 [Sphaerosporella brunnea]KAA8905004.1 hypothetical protein FN846DRAFT_779179 [Sphaerosporella brunnea]